MQKLAIDKNYTNYLIRLIENELSTNKDYNSIVNYINSITATVGSKQVMDYVKANNLSFSISDFNAKLKALMVAYDKSRQASPKEELQESRFVPVTNIDASTMSADMLKKINYIITNPNLSPLDFQVDISKGVFLNTKEMKIYKVDIIDNEFKLVSASVEEKKEDKQEELYQMKDKTTGEIKEKIEEEIVGRIEESEFNKKALETVGKIKKLVPNINNNAFVNTILLTSLSAISGIIIAALLLAK